MPGKVGCTRAHDGALADSDKWGAVALSRLQGASASLSVLSACDSGSDNVQGPCGTGAGHGGRPKSKRDNEAIHCRRPRPRGAALGEGALAGLPLVPLPQSCGPG